MKCTHFWGHISALFALVVCIKACICKRIRSLGIDSARLGIDSARLGIDFWLLKRFPNTGSAVELGGSR
jgi:hypothetical protein